MAFVLVMVGLPARGKTYTARKMVRYLSWKGMRTRVFNVGNYRRSMSGAQVPHHFFDPNNAEGMEARRNAAQHALDELCAWLKQGGDVAIYDATNSTKARRQWVMQTLDEQHLSYAFVENLCNDPSIVEANIARTKVGSPDYAGIQSQQAVDDFRKRIAHYESVYEPLEEPELRWIKIIDAGRQIIVNRCDSYLLSKIATFVMNLNIRPKTLWFSRHGQSQYNLEDRVGGDSRLSVAGEIYISSLARFFEDKPVQQLWTSTLQRTIQTASLIPQAQRQWKKLDEINAGVCDGMTYDEIQEQFPHIASSRRADKLRFRYPQGESYEDVIERLEPVIFEIERSEGDLLIVSHQAVLRCLYAYFANRPREDCPYLSIPLHTVIQLQSQTYGCVEMRFALPPQVD